MYIHKMSSAAVTDGFVRDCKTLLSNFRENNGIDFSNFCEEWKAMNFYYIFSGFRSDFEMIYHINEYFRILKKMFIASESLLDKIGIFFIMYAIYYKQPPKEFCKIKVTIDEWKEFKTFYEKLHEHSEFDKIKLIFWTLIKSGAFVFVESDRKYTFEYFVRKEYEDESSTENSNLFSKCYKREAAKLTNQESGILPALKFLEDAYNEMKDLLEGEHSSKKTLPHTSIVSELSNSFKTISTIFDIDSDEQDMGESGGGESTDSDELREQVETTIKQKRDQIKRRAQAIKSENDADSESDEDDKSIVERVKKKNTNNHVVTGENSLKICFGKLKYTRLPTKNKSTCSKLLDGIEKVASDELQEQTKLEPLPEDTKPRSLDVIL